MIIDSGNYLFEIPLGIGTAIVNLLLHNMPYYTYRHDRYFISCDTTTYPSLYLYIEGHWVEIPPSSYVLKYYSLCYLGIVATDTYYWKAGTLFIKNYYMVFDTDNAKITVAPILGGTVSEIRAD